MKPVSKQTLYNINLFVIVVLLGVAMYWYKNSNIKQYQPRFSNIEVPQSSSSNVKAALSK